MLFDISLGIREEAIMNCDPKLLDILFFDRTTKRNIIRATDDYAERGCGYSAFSEIRPKLIAGFNSMLIRPRIAKSNDSDSAMIGGCFNESQNQ